MSTLPDSRRLALAVPIRQDRGCPSGRSRVTLLTGSSGQGVPVMTGSDEGLAAAYGRMRAAHADRERVVAALKAAFVQGRLGRRLRRADRAAGIARTDT
jgi:hypothetical protein